MHSNILIDIHTHQQYQDPNIVSIFNATLNDFLIDYDNYISIGLHPWYTSKWDNLSYDLLEQKIVSNNVIAIGECGLDKLVEPLQWQSQLDNFEFQVSLSRKINKPLIIHCVKAYNECLEILGNHQAIFHGFTKRVQLANSIINKGHYVSFGKSIFQMQSKDVFEQMPLEQVFLETDTAPISIHNVYDEAVKIRKCSKDAFILQIQSNFQKLFNTHE